jgi:hypothetical protein
MKKRTYGILAVSMLAVLSLAIHVEAYPSDREAITLRGTVIDNMCADGSKDNLAEFIKTHTKQCALMEHCVASGFSIFADGELHKFDVASNKKIAEFLRKSDSKLKVVVKAENSGKELSLVSIENQK